MQSGNAGSSPLRLDFDDDEGEQQGEGERGWVRRTEEVHLNSDGVTVGSEGLQSHYNELLSEFDGLCDHFSKSQHIPILL